MEPDHRADILKMMRASFLRLTCLAAVASFGLLPIGGCRQANSFDMSRHAASWDASKRAARQDLSQIPPPLKSTYLAVTQESEWRNPLLSVERNMIQLRIYLPDENSSSIDRGGITRLTVARKQVLNIRLADLPQALSSLPDGAWPYGRVVAVGAEQETPENQPWLASHQQITINALQDMGVVVDDWNNPPLAR